MTRVPVLGRTLGVLPLFLFPPSDGRDPEPGRDADGRVPDGRDTLGREPDGRDVVGRDTGGRDVVGREGVALDTGGRDVTVRRGVDGRALGVLEGCGRVTRVLGFCGVERTVPVEFRRTVRFDPSEGRPLDPERTAGWLGRERDERDDAGARRVGAERTAGWRLDGRLVTERRLGDERVTLRDEPREGVERTLLEG